MSLHFKEIKTHLSEQFHLSTRRLYSAGSIRVSPSDCILPTSYRKFADRIKNLEVREDDVWIITYPKSGTTWTQEMVWLLMNNMNFKQATEHPLTSRSPFLEYGAITVPEEEGDLGYEDTVAVVENLSSPRCIKSHLPKDLLPDQLWSKKPKIVYVTRGAKDVLVSYYHHTRLHSGYTGSLEQFAEAFMTENIVYFDPFWRHTLDFWKLRYQPNILINSFEEMKKNLPVVVRKTEKFLGKHYGEDQISALVKHLDFSSMKSNPMVNMEKRVNILNKRFANEAHFMRQGTVGSGHKELSPELAERVDKWSLKRIQGTDYPFVG